MSLDSIVQVTIQAQTDAPSRVGFGTPLVFGFHTVFPELARVYTSTQGMLDDGFLATDAEYRAATAIFSQNPRPPQIVVGRRTNPTSMDVELTPIAVNDTLYRVTINGTNFDYISDATATVAEITAGLELVINAGSEPVTATDNTTELTLTADSAGEEFTLEVDRALLTQDSQASDGGIVTDYNNIKAVNDDFYAVVPTSHVTAEILALAAQIETEKRILLVASADDDILTGVSSDVISTLQTANYDRTICMYHPKPHQYPAGAWAGALLPTDPGSNTWKFKALNGVDSYTLSPTETTNVLGKNGGIYTVISGLPITSDGVATGGEFIDVTRGIDWLTVRMQERVFASLANAPKIPFTNAGIAVVENDVRAQLQQGIENGLLAADPAPIVIVPDAADVSSIDKANRTLPDVEFSATLAGAIHVVQISGVVSV